MAITAMLGRSDDRNGVILPVSVDDSRKAMRQTPKRAGRLWTTGPWGGAIGVFPVAHCPERAMMDFLRKATYDLGPSPFASHACGFEFEDRWKIKA